MAEPLKNNFNEKLIRQFGAELHQAYVQFDKDSFVNCVIDENWEQRELKDRMRHLTLCIHQHINLTYQKSVAVILQVAPKFKGFEAMVFPDYIEVFGLDDENVSLEALKTLTKYSSSEFAIRPFIIQNPKKVMAFMLDCSTHENHHVRRFASEGCRSRLPWAMALPDFKINPLLILPILENLNNDESLYVRKSVANNINDITKDNPEIALELTKRWFGNSDHTDWIVKHGLRTLSKNGNEEALDILGFNSCDSAIITNLYLSDQTIKIGESITFNFEISHKEPSSIFLKIGFVVTYMKSGNKTSQKIFHITEKKFESGEPYSFKKKVSFKDLSTRKHYSGKHSISILINGKNSSEKSFELLN